MKQSKRFIGVLILALLLLFGAQQLSRATAGQQAWVNPLDRFGTRDFMAFWAGTQVFLDGKNPYDGDLVLAKQRAISGEKEPQVFLNPPWALPLLVPFCSTSFNTGRFLWLILNLIFLWGSCLIIFKMLPGSRTTLSLSFFTSILFMPSIFLVWMGQLTGLVLFSMTLSIALIAKKKDLLAGFAMLPVCLKPHLLLPLLALLGLKLILAKRWSFFVSSGLAFVALAASVYLADSSIYLNWSAQNFSPLNYQTSTIATLIRQVLYERTGILYTWPAIVLPTLATLLTIWVALNKKTVLTWSSLALLLAVSLLFAPYSWAYDQVLLIPIQVLVVNAALSKPGKQVWILALLALSQAMMLPIIQFSGFNLGSFVCFPFLILLVWFLAVRMACESERGVAIL